MLASAPYAASKALCQMAKQSNSAQYRSRSENSKPKKKSFMQDGLNGAARHKDQSVYACYVQRG